MSSRIFDIHLKKELLQLLEKLDITLEISEENKEKIWNELLDPNSKYSSKEKQAMMGGFYSWD